MDLEAESSAAGGQRGIGGGAPNAAAIFLVFFKKIKHFYAYFGLNYCIKIFALRLQSVLMRRPQNPKACTLCQIVDYHTYC